MLFAVEYVYDQTRTEDLESLRPQHRDFLQHLHDEGSLVVAGRWQDAGAPGALLIVEAYDDAAALELLDADPFHRAHLITQRTARAWSPAIGKLAE
ncbi:YciI family protein [Bogoriella caseilytica]|uniref:YCII-related domain-containing protein n=1 Tax=Bogoriella caseilytica TaxID=56055 RepID=A0A3N2BGX8_9MICO|nr:YciI family protein [Bogoriella caseilytica]ROR74470.1 hypothetical protein EDD31_2886 [Bogoriella caseilytica]